VCDFGLPGVVIWEGRFLLLRREKHGVSREDCY
jgi:hypothetical protein